MTIAYTPPAHSTAPAHPTPSARSTAPAHSALGPAEREARLAELLGAEYVRPDWGLGAPEAGAGTGTHRQEPAVIEPATVVAAVALVLSHYDRLDQVVLALGAAPDGFALAALPVSGRTPVAELLRAAADRLERPWPPCGDELAASLAQADGGGEVAVAVRFGPESGDTPPFPLTITVDPAVSGAARAGFRYRRDVFDPGMVAQFARHVAHVGGQLATAAPGAELAAIQLLDPQERALVVALGDPGRAVPDQPHRIDALVAAQAAARPDAPAVSFEGEHLTYRQLDARANQIARALRESGVAAGDRVGVCLDRSAELIVTLLGVLRAGAVYVPMEPGYPAERLSYTAEDAAVVLVIAEPDGFPAAALHPRELAAAADRQLATPPPAAGSADDAAYVIYTSGSTGRPKGVAVTHRNVAGLFTGTDQDFRFDPADVWTMFHSVAFDMSVWEIWGALTTGARLVVVPHLVCRSPQEFHALLAAERVTVLNQTPSAFAQLLEADAREPEPLALRLVTFGGEPLDTRMLLPWFDRHPESECRLVNLYGITETTVHSTWQTVTRREASTASRSVGTALPGEYLYVRDSSGRLLPPGVAGEIYVGGAGVALGYLNRPELSAERFLADPDRGGGRMYRSGDKGRLLPTGVLEHLGRLDNQVKLRGYRVELDEIRAVLLEDPKVLAAAVLLGRRDPADPATDRLDAYVVLDGGDPAEVRERVSRVLPPYMVPSSVTALAALPLTVNGKLDRGRLSVPEPARAAAVQSGSLLDVVHEAWQAIVGVPVGIDDSLFDVGGNSILVGRLVKQLVQLGLPKLPLRQVYLGPTVRQLAEALEELGRQG